MVMLRGPFIPQLLQILILCMLLVGQGCMDASALHLQYTNQTSLALSQLHEYQDQMKNVLGALSSREKALTTLQTLEIDMAEKKLKLEQLEMTPGMSRRVSFLDASQEMKMSPQAPQCSKQENHL